jgi:hypothetical protein
MAWFFRVLQLADDRWACRHGRVEFDIHAEVDAAVQHVRSIAKDHESAEVMVHRLDGTVERLGLI